jgi:hypothetical protein
MGRAPSSTTIDPSGLWTGKRWFAARQVLVLFAAGLAETVLLMIASRSA